MYPSQSGGRSNDSLSVRKIENGFEVHHTKESKKLSADGNNFLYDMLNETFAFDSQEETVAKITELLSALE